MSTLVLLLLLGILLVPAYALALMLLIALPPFLVVFTLVEAKTQRGKGAAREVGARLFLALVVLPLALLAFIAPMRSVLVAVTSYYPPALQAFHAPHQFIYSLLGPVLGQPAAYWLDLYLGIYGVLMIFALALFDSARRRKLVTRIENLPTSKVRSAAVGIVELSGKAVPIDPTARTRPVIRSWFRRRTKGYSHDTTIEPFYLDDGTGRILIDASGVRVDSEPGSFSVRLHQVSLRQHLGADGLPEGRLMPGDDVFVLGIAHIDEAGADRLVVRPAKASLLRLDDYDVFFLNNRREAAVLERFKASIERGWFAVLVLMLVAGWLAVNAWTNLVQLETQNLKAPPALFRLVSAPTLLERRVEVPGAGTYPLIYWIDEIGRGGGDQYAIMQKLEEEGVAHVAVPVLRARMTDIDDAGFGAANRWLMDAGDLPPGHWGFEFYGPEQEASGDTMIFRVLLTREGSRLLVSYHAYFNETQPINSTVAVRQVVMVFKNLRSGESRTAAFDAVPGWNRHSHLEAFSDFAPGEYQLRIYPKRQFQNGLWDAGSHPIPDLRVRL